jgi:hypothetical protein
MSRRAARARLKPVAGEGECQDRQPGGESHGVGHETPAFLPHALDLFESLLGHDLKGAGNFGYLAGKGVDQAWDAQPFYTNQQTEFVGDGHMRRGHLR